MDLYRDNIEFKQDMFNAIHFGYRNMKLHS